MTERCVQWLAAASPSVCLSVCSWKCCHAYMYIQSSPTLEVHVCVLYYNYIMFDIKLYV